jgi:hypothetical protein
LMTLALPSMILSAFFGGDSGGLSLS